MSTNRSGGTDRPRRDDRGPREDRGRRDERGTSTDRSGGTDRPRRDDRGPREDRGRRDERGTSTGRSGGADRPRRDDRGPRDDRGRREDKTRRDDREGARPRRTESDKPPRRDSASERSGPKNRPNRPGQPHHGAPVDEPEIPADVEFDELDTEVRRELRSVPKDLAERVGKHLVAAGRLLDDDPEAALAHARYAKVKASRIPVIREALGLTAYRAGQWSEALSELRAVRRMTHSDVHLAVIADSERALGRPERALDLAKETATDTLPKEVAVELRIVAAGARRDLGQIDAAVVLLQGSDLDPEQQHPWSARLFYAYADNLLAAGRTEEAVRWFLHAAEADAEEETDAAERALELSA